MAKSNDQCGEYRQFAVLLLGLICMGAVLGFERSLLPRMAVDIFHETSALTRLNFVATFGGFKAVANIISGPLADRFGRKPALVSGFVVGLPVMPYIIVADSWTGVTVINVLFGLSQGLLGSALFFLLIDVMGPDQRGIAVGLGECTIYVSTAVVNMWAGALASKYGYRPVPFLYATGFAILGLLSTIPLRDTLDMVHAEQSQQSLHQYSSDSSEEDVDDDLSDEADLMEYGLNGALTCGFASSLTGGLTNSLIQGGDSSDKKVPAGVEDSNTLDTIGTTEEMHLLLHHPGLPAQSSEEKPTMHRVWSGDFDDFEGDLDRMLKTVKGTAPQSASYQRGGEDAGCAAAFRDRMPIPRASGHHHHRRAGSSGMEGSNGGHVRRMSSNSVGSNMSGRSGATGMSGASGEVRLLAETQWTRYMSVEPPSALAAKKKVRLAEEEKKEELGLEKEASEEGGPASPVKKGEDDGMIPDPPLEVLANLLRNANYVSLCLVGLAINFKDGFAWGTFPVFFSNVHHLSDSRTDLLIALYPLCWGLAQAFTGAASDHFGRQLFLVSGVGSCSVSMVLFALPGMVWGRTYTYLGEVDAAGFVWIVADILLGLGTALAYPALQAGAADEVDPINRGLGLGFYRFVRDMGYVAGALVGGMMTDGIGYQATFLVVAGVLGVCTYLMGFVYLPRRKTVLIGGGRRIVLVKKRESLDLVGGAGGRGGYAD